MVGSAGSRGVFAGGTLGALGGPVGQALGQAAGQVLGYPGASGQAPTIAANDPAPAAPSASVPAAGGGAAGASSDPAQMVTKLFHSAGGALNGIARRFPWWLWFFGGAVLMWFVGRKGLLKKALSAVG